MAQSQEDIQAELDAILANAQERADILEAAERRADFMDDPLNEFGYQYTVGMSNTLGIPVDIVNGIANAVGLSTDAPLGSGDNIQDLFNMVTGAPEGLPEEPEGPMQGAANLLGVTTVMTPAFIAPYMDQAMMPQEEFDRLTSERLAQFQGTGPGTPGEIPRTRAQRALFLLNSIQRDAARFAAQNPKSFIAGEIGAAGLAGAAGEFAEERGAGPGLRMSVETGAGVVGGMTPAAIPTQARNLYRWGMRHIFPMTPEGGRIRAAGQMQERAEDPEAAAEAIRQALLPQRDEAGNVIAPAQMEGVDPARVTGERRLMAQTQRVLEDDPALDKLVREDLSEATRRAVQELRGLYETPRGRAAWEQAIFDRLAPPGVTIRQGSSEEMLEQLYRSFGPLYDEFKGYPIRPQLFGSRETPLEVMIGNVPNSNRVHADDATRQAVARRLQAIWGGFARRVKDGVADSGDYFRLRSNIRDEARKRTRAGDDGAAGLYHIAEEAINAVLRSQLPEGVMPAVRGVDQHYRNYHILADAIYRRGGSDAGLTPEGLQMALKMTAPSAGSFARGSTGELTAMAASGKPIADVLGDPYAVARRVRNMDPTDLQAVHNDIYHTMLQRAKIFDADTGTEGISGARLQQILQENADSLVAARMNEEQIARANELAEQLRVMEAKSPSAVAQLYEDGPANILELFATLAGAKHGQNVAGRGIGSGLVLAQYFAKKARGILETITTTQAEDLLTAAVNDPELYMALLTKPDARPTVQYEAAQLVNAYLLDIARRTTEDVADYYKETHKRESNYRDRLRELQDQLRESNANLMY